MLAKTLSGLKVFYFFTCLIILAAGCKTKNQSSAADTIQADTTTYEEEKNEISAGKVKFCNELVKEILSSSPRYKKITHGLLAAVKKNGGLSVDIVIDRSPESGSSGTGSNSPVYELKVTESYPDRQVNIAHFTFDPQRLTLFEYDVVRDRLVTVEFDKSLLEHPEEYCR